MPPAPRPALREPIRTPPTAEFEFAVSGDKFDINPDYKDPKLDYQWRRYSVMGMVDRRGMAIDTRNRWVPVDASMFPENPTDDPDGKLLIIDGLILKCRAKEISDQARAKQKRDANSQRREEVERLGLNKEGTLPRTKPTVKRTYEAIAVPDDNDGQE